MQYQLKSWAPHDMVIQRVVEKIQDQCKANPHQSPWEDFIRDGQQLLQGQEVRGEEGWGGGGTQGGEGKDRCAGRSGKGRKVGGEETEGERCAAGGGREVCVGEGGVRCGER